MLGRYCVSLLGIIRGVRRNFVLTCHIKMTIQMVVVLNVSMRPSAVGGDESEPSINGHLLYAIELCCNFLLLSIIERIIFSHGHDNTYMFFFKRVTHSFAFPAIAPVGAIYYLSSMAKTSHNLLLSNTSQD